jgi:hypothetical protein
MAIGRMVIIHTGVKQRPRIISSCESKTLALNLHFQVPYKFRPELHFPLPARTLRFVSFVSLHQPT